MKTIKAKKLQDMDTPNWKNYLDLKEKYEKALSEIVEEVDNDIMKKKLDPLVKELKGVGNKIFTLVWELRPGKFINKKELTLN